MQNRAYGFVALLAVIGVSIVFGMLLGGRLERAAGRVRGTEHVRARSAAGLHGCPGE